MIKRPGEKAAAHPARAPELSPGRWRSRGRAVEHGRALAEASLAAVTEPLVPVSGALPAQRCGGILSVEHEPAPWPAVLMKDAPVLQEGGGVGEEAGSWGANPPSAKRSVLWALQRVMNVSCGRGWGWEGTPEHPLLWLVRSPPAPSHLGSRI